jgi:glycerophosphoryl diester phosphodiesterase
VEVKPPDAELLVQRTTRAMRACKLRWMIQSFDRTNLFHARRFAHDVPQALLIEKDHDLKLAIDENWPGLHVAYDLLSESLVKRLHDDGRSIGVWTPNSKKQLQHAIASGVDRIITDEPMMAISLLKEHCVESG